MYSSPFLRARSTAKHIAEANKCHPEILIMENLKEQEYGATLTQFMQQGNHWMVRILRYGDLINGNLDRTYRPKNEGESLNDVGWRAKSAVLMAIEKHGVESQTQPAIENTPHVVFVSHNLLLVELYEALGNFIFPDHAEQEEHAWRMVSYNNTSWCV
jgi:broad specificity phosphatase PhoE